MCNINALFVKNKTTKITPFLMAVSSHSFASNNHGEGTFFSSNNEVIKSVDKINLFESEDAIERSKVVITHQRFSTSGFEVEYNHPFESEEFILVHNGVINQFKGPTGSDTYGFFTKFVTEFDLILSHLSREEKIVKTINKLLKENIGSYSILIYDKNTGKAYYFKNFPSINFYKSDNYLFITTNSDNDAFLPMIDKKFVELKIEHRKIYRIDADNKVFSIANMPEEKKEEKKSGWITSKETSKKDYQSKISNMICDTCKEPIEHSFYSFENRTVCFDCYKKEHKEWNI